MGPAPFQTVQSVTVVRTADMHASLLSLQEASQAGSRVKDSAASQQVAKAQHAAFVALQQPLHQLSGRRASERSDYPGSEVIQHVSVVCWWSQKCGASLAAERRGRSREVAPRERPHQPNEKAISSASLRQRSPVSDPHVAHSFVLGTWHQGCAPNAPRTSSQRLNWTLSSPSELLYFFFYSMVT